MRLTICIILLLIVSVLQGKSNDPGPKFTVIKESKGVTLSSRWRTTSSNSKTRELKAEFYVSANPEVVLALIKNAGMAKNWMKNLSEYSIVKLESENSWYAYIQYNIPWPLNNQDCIIRYNYIRSKDGKNYELNLQGYPSYLPRREGVERISHMVGSWKLSKGSGSDCRVEYTVYSEQKPVFPRWATDPLIQKNLIDTMASMRELSEEMMNK
ncbi:MAG TPA: hypothetical protein VK179_19365 [Bacteroidales bacterium]|nr:hypothetical protein [Bacteroidales bacterium]